MLRKLFVVMMAAALVFPALAGAAQQSNLDLTARTPGNATLRSAVLPGWGQWFNGQNKKAYIFGSCAIAGIAATLVLNAKASATYSDYEKIGVKSDALYADYETQQGQAMSAGIFTAAVWIYAMIDAYVVGEKQGKQQGGMLNGGFKLAGGSQNIGLSFTKRF